MEGPVLADWGRRLDALRPDLKVAIAGAFVDRSSLRMGKSGCEQLVRETDSSHW
jgi:hypothetical protein